MTTPAPPRIRRRTRMWLMPLTIVALLAGCGGGSGDDGSSSPSGPSPSEEESGGGEGTPEGDANTVVVSGFRFDPEEIEVPAGTEVTWRNDDSVSHTVTVDGDADAGADDLDISLDGAGSSAGHRFAEAGTFPYHCEIHPSMTGLVVVG